MKRYRKRTMRPVADRFAEKVVPEPMSGCHLWIGHVDHHGYGKLWVDTGHRQAHRVAWELAHGPIPTGSCVLHRCDNPACVNPTHLSLGTQGDNMADMVAKGRSGRGEHHAQAKLTEAQAREILECKGIPAPILASRFGVSVSAVGHVKRGYSWGCLREQECKP